jgi:hypothetical protein
MKIFIFTVFLSSSIFAAEGFYHIKDLVPEYGFKIKSYFSHHNCGSVRIHKTKNIYLTALHCFAEELEPIKGVTLGNPMEYENLGYYKNEVGKVINGKKFKILANGNCFSGFGLDIINQETISNQMMAIECIQGDWLIYEDLTMPQHHECVKVTEPKGIEAMALGAPRKTVDRKVGLKKLDGNVYSKGNLLTLDEVKAPGVFLFPDVWHFTDTNRDSGELLEKHFYFSDIDVIPGMSGGPVLTKNFEIIGISTLKLGPNSLWRYPNAPTYDDFMNASHGILKIKSIQASLKKMEIPSENFFDCH